MLNVNQSRQLMKGRVHMLFLIGEELHVSDIRQHFHNMCHIDCFPQRGKPNSETVLMQMVCSAQIKFLGVISHLSKCFCFFSLDCIKRQSSLCIIIAHATGWDYFHCAFKSRQLNIDFHIHASRRFSTTGPSVMTGPISSLSALMIGISLCYAVQMQNSPFQACCQMNTWHIIFHFKYWFITQCCTLSLHNATRHICNCLCVQGGFGSFTCFSGGKRGNGW